MKPKRRQRLVLVGLLVAGVGIAVGLALLALQENINLFFSPSQVAAGDPPVGSPYMLGGMVVDGSVSRVDQSLEIRFDLTDTANTVTVAYTGILPDLFREGQGIVAQGSVNDNGLFTATQVLAKHDETYMPPEVIDALDKAKAMGVQ